MEHNQLERILEIAEESILKYGVKGITMDDIAKELGMSKKTLYMAIDSKNDLIAMVSKNISNKNFEKIKELELRKLDPISEMLEINQIINETIERIDPSIISQFQKFYNDIYQKNACAEKDAFIQILVENLKRGINEGVYRPDIDVEFIAYIQYNVSKSIFEITMQNENRDEHIKYRKEYMIYHLRGIASYKGLSFIESKLTER